MSAIDWLDRPENLAALPARPVTPPEATPALPVTPPPGFEAPVADQVVTPEVTMQPLDAPQPGAVGLLPRSVTGLPASLWEKSLAASLVRRLRGTDLVSIPAMQSLMYTLLLTEADPPVQSPGGISFLLARIDKLVDMGAVDPALALADRAGPTSHPDLFARWFDLTLLAGDENRACLVMRDRPSLAPSEAALTFCRASQGQFDLAALTFGTAAALGMMDPAEETLLSLFLDPALAEETPALPPPAKMTPLVFRLSEGIGHPVPSSGLPRAYAMTDLRGVSGWRAEIEAAERLTQTGALAENRLLGIYTDREPAASGDPWDRVEAIQALDTAIARRDAAAISDALPKGWRALQSARLEVPFARLWGETLAGYDLTGPAQAIQFDMAMLSPQYETLAAKLPRPDAQHQFIAALAAGEPGAAEAPDALSRAIQRGFAPDTELPPAIRLDLAQGKLGEAILVAMDLIAKGAEGNIQMIAPGLATLRAVGLEDTARRTALQLMLLERQL
ncbi:hypothetical protein [Pseudooceanicola sp. MF1-13]|uniref:hypothetical protein n=1 Tax=Pseudooceanicola sp. MF1-13 TaxID=3379095 RepID=UPI003892A7C5